MSYPVYSLGEYYPSAEVQSVYSTAQADKASNKLSPVSKQRPGGDGPQR